ncbi:MAG: hypothetical protein JWN86_2570 [Planctomycetota bacterium]|nr:hypothetical protein [Planctomycetota bacterium]
MGTYKRSRTTPSVEALENKTLLAASIGGLHTLQAASGATVTVERERFRVIGNQMILNLQLNSGGQRFTEVFRLNARKLTPNAVSTLSESDLINQFATAALASLSGSQGRNASFSNVINSGGVRFNQSVSIRGSSPGAVNLSNLFSSTDAFNALVQDLTGRIGSQTGSLNRSFQSLFPTGTTTTSTSTSLTNGGLTASSLNSALNGGTSSSLSGRATTGNTAGLTSSTTTGSTTGISTNAASTQTRALNLSQFNPGVGSTGTAIGNGFQAFGAATSPNGVGFQNIAIPTISSLTGAQSTNLTAGTFNGTATPVATVTPTGTVTTATGTGVTGTGVNTSTVTATGIGPGLVGTTTTIGTIDSTGSLTGTGNGTGFFGNGFTGTTGTSGTIDATGTFTGTGNGTGFFGNGFAGTTGTSGTVDATGTFTGAGNGTGLTSTTTAFTTGLTGTTTVINNTGVTGAGIGVGTGFTGTGVTGTGTNIVITSPTGTVTG